MTTSTAVRRPGGIPGSDAAEQVRQMGGPVATRRTAQHTQTGIQSQQSRRSVPVDADVADREEPGHDRTGQQRCDPVPLVFSTNRRRHVDHMPSQTTMGYAQQRPASRSAPSTEDSDELEEEEEVEAGRLADDGDDEPGPSMPLGPRTPSRARPRATAQRHGSQPGVSPVPGPRRRPTSTQRRVHWLLPVGAGMLLMLLLYVVVSFIHVWAVGLHDDWSYGTTRTYHLDAVVDSKDSVAHPTHFVAMNLRGQIIIIELASGDVRQARIYRGPRLPWENASASVLTLELKDVTGDGRPDLLVHIQQEPTLFVWQPPVTTLVMVNTGAGFQPPIQQQQ